MAPDPYVLRIADAALDESLAESPIVMLTGPRASGKTTTATRRASTVVRLDAPGQAAQFRSDPDAALRRLTTPALLDEWQNVPEVLPALKRLADDDPTPGRFIVTGSARFDRSPDLWPGTGRIARLGMFGLTEDEIAQRIRPDLPSRLTRDDLDTTAVDDLPSYIERATRGGMPLVALRGRSAAAWYGNYIEQLVDRDLLLAGTAADPDRLLAYLVALAENTAGTPSNVTLSTAAGISPTTARRYDDLLSGLGLVEFTPAWTTNRLKRLSSRQKIHITDTGLAAAALQADTDDLLADGSLYGHILESFVAAQLRPHLATRPRRRLHHLRSSDGRHEVDLIIDLGHRGLLAIEVKAAADVSRKDAKHLEWLRESLGSRFLRGIVFHTGPAAFAIGDRIVAAPISALWS